VLRALANATEAERGLLWTRGVGGRRHEHAHVGTFAPDEAERLTSLVALRSEASAILTRWIPGRSDPNTVAGSAAMRPGLAVRLSCSAFVFVDLGPEHAALSGAELRAYEFLGAALARRWEQHTTDAARASTRRARTDTGAGLHEPYDPPLPRATERLELRMSAFERVVIEEALDRTKWNISEAARALGISRQHLHNLSRKHGLERP
jgi:hypothetical protein